MRSITLRDMQVLRTFLELSDMQLAGTDIMRRNKISSGTLYPMLMRFEKAGLLKSSWESGLAAELGRPRCHLYQLTSKGAKFTRKVTATSIAGRIIARESKRLLESDPARLAQIEETAARFQAGKLYEIKAQIKRR